MRRLRNFCGCVDGWEVVCCLGMRKFHDDDFFFFLRKCERECLIFFVFIIR